MLIFVAFVGEHCYGTAVRVSGKQMQPTGKQPVKLLRRARTRSGASLVEYAIILALVAMIVVLVLRGLGTTTANSMNPVNNALSE